MKAFRSLPKARHGFLCILEEPELRFPAMSMIDPEQEKRRLADFYAGQMDGELEKVAAEAYELTELAREALRSELVKRGLTPRFTEQAPIIVKKEPEREVGDPTPSVPPEEEISGDDGEFEFRNRILIRRFRDLPEALLAKGSLDSAGIDCALGDDNIVRMDWLWSNSMGGVKLFVDAEDASAANEILSQPIPEHLDVPGIGDYAQPHCPKCGSLDVNFQELEPAAYASLWVGVPLPFQRRAWRCRSCGAEWEDEVPSPDPSPA